MNPLIWSIVFLTAFIEISFGKESESKPHAIAGMQKYKELRNTITDIELDWLYGSSQELSENDEKLNGIYKQLKEELLTQGFRNESLFEPSKYFISNSSEYDPDDDVYRIIRRLPKAAVLRTHQSATYDLTTFPHFLFSLENCRICENGFGSYRLHYYDDGVQDYPGSYICRKCPEKGDDNYDQEIALAKKRMSLYDGKDYSSFTIQEFWENFNWKFEPIEEAKFVYDVWIAMLREGLDFLIRDNVQYAELRTGCGDRKHRNGTAVPFEEMFQVVDEIVEEYKSKHPNFYGVNFIVTISRKELSDEKLLYSLNQANYLYQNWPAHVRAFDLLDWEDSNNSRSFQSMANVIQQWRISSGSDMPFALQAGETLWSGFESDQNVIDAILLGTKRIGHGYALDAHPVIIELIRELEVCIELSPISNQVVGLVDDLRNHMAKKLLHMANKPGILSVNPIRFSVSSDDCLFFGTKPVTDGLYAVVLAMMPKQSGLEVVKRLAYDSIYSSFLDEAEKSELTDIFEAEWDRAVKELLEQYY